MKNSGKNVNWEILRKHRKNSRKIYFNSNRNRMNDRNSLNPVLTVTFSIVISSKF